MARVGGNWITGLAIGVGAVIILPLAAPILRPLAKTAIKGGILAYRGGAGLVEGIGDLVAEIVAETKMQKCDRAPFRGILCRKALTQSPAWGNG